MTGFQTWFTKKPKPNSGKAGSDPSINDTMTPAKDQENDDRGALSQAVKKRVAEGKPLIVAARATAGGFYRFALRDHDFGHYTRLSGGLRRDPSTTATDRGVRRRPDYLVRRLTSPPCRPACRLEP